MLLCRGAMTIPVAAADVSSPPSTSHFRPPEASIGGGSDGFVVDWKSILERRRRKELCQSLSASISAPSFLPSLPAPSIAAVESSSTRRDDSATWLEVAWLFDKDLVDFLNKMTPPSKII